MIKVDSIVYGDMNDTSSDWMTVKTNEVIGLIEVRSYLAITGEEKVLTVTEEQFKVIAEADDALAVYCNQKSGSYMTVTPFCNGKEVCEYTAETDTMNIVSLLDSEIELIAKLLKIEAVA